MSFGLCNAPATFQCIMNRILFKAAQWFSDCCCQLTARRSQVNQWCLSLHVFASSPCMRGFPTGTLVGLLAQSKEMQLL